VSTSHLPAQLIEIVTRTGITLDPVYTLKGVRGMLGEMQGTPGRFAGKRILYLHTGMDVIEAFVSPLVVVASHCLLAFRELKPPHC